MSKDDELNDIICNWNEFLASLRPRNLSLESLLRSSAPISVENGTLTLGFAFGFHRDKIAEDRNLRHVVDALRDTFDKEYDVICVLDNQLNSCIPTVEKRLTVVKQKQSNTIQEIPQIKIPKTKTESPIEEIFWNALSLDDFIIPQFRIGKYRVDFAIPSHRIVIELDGHNYHSTKKQRTNDAQRERWLKLNGWDVIRFTGTEVWNNVNECIRELKRYLEIRK